MGEITYSIAEVSERLNLSYRTLHYYEQFFGIPVKRDDAGNRKYTEENIAVFELIIDLKQKEMSLRGIKKMLQERNILPKTNPDVPVVVNEKTIELKEYIISEMKMMFLEVLDETNARIDKLIIENEELREELRKLSRQSEEHFSKIDKQISEWRNRQPWYKKLFRKE